MSLGITLHVDHRVRLAACALLLALAPGCRAAPESGPEPGPPGHDSNSRDFHQVGEISSPGMPEISGLAASQRSAERLWAINDSGNPAKLFLLDETGQRLAALPVVGARNIDWEDLASFRDSSDRAWLLIADIGDNQAKRTEVRLLLVPEPFEDDREARVAATLRFQYEEGPRDAEGLAVDLLQGQVLITDKRHSPVGLYALPLEPILASAAQDTDAGADAGAGATLIATRIAEFPALAQEPLASFDPGNLLRMGMATALDLSPDGLHLAVLTYQNAALYERSPQQTWSEVSHTVPRFIALPRRPMLESLAWTREGDALWLTPESGRKPAPLYRWMAPASRPLSAMEPAG